MKIALVTLVLTALSLSAPAADWPAWRGPTGQGHSDEKNLPITWGPTENVRWKIPLADPGNSTPVVHGDKIFLTQATKGGNVRSLLCFARADGKLLWQADVKYDQNEKAYNPTWYANASPVVDGERVVVSFASAGMYCYDLAGKELWKRTDLGGKWEHGFGSGTSPVLFGDLAILWCGPNEKGRNFILAVNKKTGETAWEHDESYGSWSTPLIARVKDQDQLILGQSKDVKNAGDANAGFLRGYDPKTGKELWKCRGLNSYTYTSALYADGVAVGMSGYGGSALAVDLSSDAAGDITDKRLWLHPKPAAQRVGSGVIVGGHVYMVDENLTPHCYELKTGNDLWKPDPRMKGDAKGDVSWGSLVHTGDGLLYLLTRSGRTIVMKASPTFEIVAINALGNGEQSNSSPAISDGDIFLRTFKTLWCISAKK